MSDIRIASGKTYLQFNNYVDLRYFEYDDIEFIEICIEYIIAIECMRKTHTEYIESIQEFGCDTGYQMIMSNHVSLGKNISKDSVSKRYIRALSNILDYIQANNKDARIRNDELKAAYGEHKKHKKYDNSAFYSDIILLASLSQLFKNKYIKEFRFISPNKYLNVLKELHRVTYKMFIGSKYVTENSKVVINPLSGIADFIEYEDRRNFEFSIFINDTLYMILVDSINEFNDVKWRNLKLKYKSLLIEKATERKNRCLDYKLINKLALFRAVNGEIEVMLDLKNLRKEAYNFYTTKDIVNLLQSIEESIVSEQEFFERLEN